jgi:hypothetical protein
MNEKDPNVEIPFSPDAWVIDRNNPAQPGQYTGIWRKADPHTLLQLSYPGGGMRFRPLASLEEMPEDYSEDDRGASAGWTFREGQRSSTADYLREAQWDPP